jgi:hypothetical protein
MDRAELNEPYEPNEPNELYELHEPNEPNGRVLPAVLVPIEVYSMRPNVPRAQPNEREGEPWNQRSPQTVQRLIA